jgi:hypothetical protein
MLFKNVSDGTLMQEMCCVSHTPQGTKKAVEAKIRLRTRFAQNTPFPLSSNHHEELYHAYAAVPANFDLPGNPQAEVR